MAHELRFCRLVRKKPQDVPKTVISYQHLKWVSVQVNSPNHH